MRENSTNMPHSHRILEKIKSRGYWVIEFEPARPISQPIERVNVCREIMEKSVVRLRGWDYPHIPTRQDDDSRIYASSNHIEAYIDWWAHKELWRYYQDAKFVHFMGIHEDWFEDEEWASEVLKSIEPGSILNVINTIYTLTEIFEFFRNLVKQEIYDVEMNVNILLHGVRNRKLKILDPSRVPLMTDYISHIPENEIVWRREGLSKDSLIEQSANFAYDVIIYIFDRFNWTRLPEEVIKNDQRKFLQRNY